MAGQPAGVWRDTGRETKFWIFNSSTVFPIVFFLFNISWYTFGIVVGTIAVLTILGYYGFKPLVFGRFFRGLLAGSRRSARPWWVS